MKLTHKHTKAIAGLLSEPTIKDAAKLAGVTERTIYNWLNDETFRAELAKAEAEAVSNAARKVAFAGELAVNHLIEIVEDEDAEPGERRQAANSLLSHLPKLRLLGSLEATILELQQNLTGDNEL